MHDTRGDDDELAVAAVAREPDGVVVHAEVRIADAAAWAAEAGDVPFAYDARAGLDAGHTLADRVDDTAPFVAGDDRKAHPTRVEGAGEDVEVGAADARADAADPYVARAGHWCLDVAQGDRVRLLDHDGAHGDDRVSVRQPARRAVKMLR
jgi:hypothetical protein